MVLTEKIPEPWPPITSGPAGSSPPVSFESSIMCNLVETVCLSFCFGGVDLRVLEAVLDTA
jgi:hypothetical protein